MFTLAQLGLEILLSTALAADFYSVNAGTNQEITEFSVCRDVINAATLAVFVPTRTDPEWTAFYNNPPTGVAAASCSGDWYNPAWLYRVKITIDHTKVSADLTNFPVLITEANMPAAFWTHVKANGSDIVVTSSDGVTKLDRELVSIATGTPALELHVRSPAVADLSPTVFFLYYGNAAGAETNVATTWSAYRNVYHMLTTTPVDSTATTSTSGVSGSSTVGGKIGIGLSFNGTGKVDLASQITTHKTLSFWYYPRTNGGGNFGSVFGSNDYNHGLRHVGGDPMVLRRSGTAIVSTSSTYNVWKHLMFAYDSGTGKVTLIENGVAGTAVTLPSGWYTLYHLISINNATDRAPDGIVDEMRISNTTLTVGWAATEYANQNSPATFYSVSAEVAKP